jgi:hypothetical protein
VHLGRVSTAERLMRPLVVVIPDEVVEALLLRLTGLDALDARLGLFVAIDGRRADYRNLGRW